jgi:hypothetical protein
VNLTEKQGAYKTGSKLMKCITTLFAAVTLLCLCAATACAQAPKELDLKVVEAWKKAGAIVGWYGQDRTFGGWRFLEAEPKDPAALPAFHWGSNFKHGVILKLPAPSVPFALDLGLAHVADAGLKEVAGLKRLKYLHLAGTKVTDAGVADLGQALPKLTIRR